MRPVVDVVPFTREHLDAVVNLCRDQGWVSLPSDPDRALRALQAPGVTTVVARDKGAVVGFAQMLSDGEIQAYLALLLVAETHRHQGIARRLVQQALRLAGGARVDLLSDRESTGFYRSLPHRRYPGFRVYPLSEGR
jgi:ribosomal protein S18 acetylase RimI-like enzyme